MVFPWLWSLSIIRFGEGQCLIIELYTSVLCITLTSLYESYTCSILCTKGSFSWVIWPDSSVVEIDVHIALWLFKCNTIVVNSQISGHSLGLEVNCGG